MNQEALREYCYEMNKNINGLNTSTVTCNTKLKYYQRQILLPNPRVP